MNLFKQIGKAFGNTVSKLEDKNRNAARVNRIRTTLKFEEKAAEKHYLALGRYYYNNLRDAKNETTEAHCAELDTIQSRINVAMNQLEEYYAEESKKRAASVEEIDLDDVIEVDADAKTEQAEAPEEEADTTSNEKSETPEPEKESQGADKEENDSLPFE